MASQTEIFDLLETLTGVYGTEPANVKGYLWALEEYDGDLLDAVGKDAVRFCKWFPKPAELREIAERKQNERDKGEEPAKMYWRMVNLASDWFTGKNTDAKTDAAVKKYFGLSDYSEQDEAESRRRLAEWLAEPLPAWDPPKAIPGRSHLADYRWLEQYYSEPDDIELEELVICEDAAAIPF